MYLLFTSFNNQRKSDKKLDQVSQGSFSEAASPTIQWTHLLGCPAENKSTKTGRPEGGDGPTTLKNRPLWKFPLRCVDIYLDHSEFSPTAPLIVQRECWGLGNYVLSVCFVCSIHKTNKQTKRSFKT